ncbi:hypothetical protein EV401DRAFT_2077827 [Pisolithus croceorrhizus]|nr:hypothetical protein EV401DRAFT_2077827 [Pisolithus croceorrhizus]
MSHSTTPSWSYPPPPNEIFLLEGLEGPVETLSPSAAVHSSGRVQLRNVKPIASYSWIDGTTPCVVVPGYPRVWTNIPVKTVPADSGVHHVDRNTSFMGHRSPLIPIFAAVDSLHIDFKYRDLDLITDRNSLRKLLRCIDRQHDKTFRIDVDLLGKTCLLTRCEETLTDTIKEFRGYGHEYVLAATKPRRGSEEEISHHRIISYDFGGLKILLRSAVDAYAEPSSEDDSFLASFSALSIGTRRTSKFSNDSVYSSRFGVKVKLTSPRIVLPQSSVIEIKTRASCRELDWKEVYPQLYLSQTPYLYLAKYARRKFGQVEKVKINTQTMATHTKEAEAAMVKLEALLSDILKTVRKHGDGVPLSLVYHAGELQLYKRREETRHPFGKDISNKFQRAAAI